MSESIIAYIAVVLFLLSGMALFFDISDFLFGIDILY